MNDNPVNFTDPEGLLAKNAWDQAVSYYNTNAEQIKEFGKGFIPGYDLYQATQNSNAGAVDYAVGVLGVLPGLGKGAGLGIKAVDGAVDAGKGIKAYEVGAYNELKASSMKGDMLDIHHAGQANPMEQIIPGYNRSNAPSISLPANEHQMIPTQKGLYEGAARDQLAKDIRDLRNYTNAPNSSLQELIQLNKDTYPNSFRK